jgi:hypothetical protein
MTLSNKTPHRSLLRSLAITALAGLAAFSAAPAADPVRSAPAVSDVVLARSALSAIDADPVLREANLLVSIVDRVAVVGGPVRSAEHGKRAEAIVRRVPGIVDVKNRCFVQDVPDSLLQAISAKPATKPANLPGVVASPRTGQVEEFAPPLAEPVVAKVEPTGKPVVALRPMNPGDGVLLPPVEAAPKPMGTPAPAVLTSGRTAEAMTAAEALRKAEARYAGLSVAFANGTFVISGRAARAADAWELAQELRRIPGVPRVAVGSVDVK